MTSSKGVIGVRCSNQIEWVLICHMEKKKTNSFAYLFFTELCSSAIWPHQKRFQRSSEQEYLRLIKWERIIKWFLKTWASIWPHSQADRNTELLLLSLRVGVLQRSVQRHVIESDKTQRTPRKNCCWRLLCLITLVFTADLSVCH